MASARRSCFKLRTQHVPYTQCQEFADVFSLCVEVLEKADKASLIKTTLEAMLRFLNWIPLGYIFETPVIDNLISRVSQAKRTDSFQLLTSHFGSSSKCPNSET